MRKYLLGLLIVAVPLLIDLALLNGLLPVISWEHLGVRLLELALTIGLMLFVSIAEDNTGFGEVSVPDTIMFAYYFLSMIVILALRIFGFEALIEVNILTLTLLCIGKFIIPVTTYFCRDMIDL